MENKILYIKKFLQKKLRADLAIENIDEAEYYANELSNEFNGLLKSTNKEVKRNEQLSGKAFSKGAGKRI